jgi:hypothetical protein
MAYENEFSPPGAPGVSVVGAINGWRTRVGSCEKSFPVRFYPTLDLAIEAAEHRVKIARQADSFRVVDTDIERIEVASGNRWRKTIRSAKRLPGS